MTKQLGRWKCSTSLIGARDDAYLPSITDEPVRARTSASAWVDDREGKGDDGRVTHTHVYLPAEWFAPATPRRTTHDAMAPIRRPAASRGDQDDPQAGQLICTIGQHGESGDWHAFDGNGRSLMVTTAGDGTLEMRHAGNGNGEQEEDPDQIRLQAPPGTNANTGAPGENDPGRAKAFEARMAAAIAPGKDADQRNPSGIRGLSALLASHYKRR